MTEVSLIVGAIDRPRPLERLLDSLSRQTLDASSFEVIIVDQSEDQTARSVAEQYNSSLRIAVISAPPGLARARNIGLKEACGNIVGFPDDDCWYDETVLERVSRWFGKNRRYGILGGSFAEPERENPHFDPRPRDITLASRPCRINSNSLFVRRSALTAVWFDERLGVGTSLPAGEETDMVVSLVRLGNLMRYDPSFVVFHPISRSSHAGDDSVFRRERANGFVQVKQARLGGLLPWIMFLGSLLHVLRLFLSIERRSYRVSLARARSSGFLLALTNGHRSIKESS